NWTNLLQLSQKWKSQPKASYKKNHLQVSYKKLNNKNGKRKEEEEKKFTHPGQQHRVHGITPWLTTVRESQDGHIITVNAEIKQQPFQITNIYALPKSEDRVRFFENWTPPVAEGRICIIAGDFNTNLDPQNDRISSAPAQPDRLRNLSSITLKLQPITRNTLRFLGTYGHQE
ncbi:136_t:CDS:2, partial [Gigaspora rosea]